MADDKIILHVDTGAMQKEIADATAKLVVMRNQMAILDDAMKKGNISVDDYAKKSSVLKQEITATTQQQSASIKVLNQYAQHNNHAAGSVDALKIELAVLTAQYNALSQEERENSAIGKELTRQTKEVSDKLKEAGKAIGDNRREVGNYRESIEKAILGNSEFADGLSVIREGFSTLKDAFTDFGQGIKDKFAEVNQGVDGTTKGIGNAHKAAIGFGIGLKAIGIGIIIAAIAGLVNYFTQTREGADKIGQAFAYLGGVVDELAKRSAAFGKAIFDAVTQPMKQVEKLGNFLKLAFTDPQAAVAQLKKGVSDMVVDLDDLSRAANRTGMAMLELKKASQQLERDRIENIATSKELIRQEEALKNIRDNEFNSISKRIEANEKAANVEKQRLTIVQDLAQRNVDLLMKEAEVRGGIEKLSNEQLKTLREAELELADLREESVGRENELITNRYQLEQERIQQINERKLNQLAIEQGYLELALDRAYKGGLEELRIKEELIEKGLEIENNALGISRDQRILNEERANHELLKLREEYFKGLEIQYRDFSENVLGPITKADVEKQIEALGQRLEAQQNLNVAIADSEEELQRTKIDAMSAGVDALKGFFGEQSEAAKAFYLVQKGFAVADIILNLQTEIAKIASANAILGPAGIPLTVAQSLAAKIRAGIGIATIAAQTVQEFTMAEGGVIQGPSHAAGGVKGTGRFANVEVEGGEAVINKRSTAQYRDLLSQINVAGGGKPLTLNRFMAAGGFTAAPAPVFPMVGATTTAIDYNRLADAMARRPAVVAVSEINRVNNKVQVKRSKTDI